MKNKRAALLGLGLCLLIKALSYAHEVRRSARLTAQLSAREVVGGLGVSLGLFASDPRWDYGQLVDEIAALGVKRLTVVVPLQQRAYDSDGMRLKVPIEVIHKTITQAKARQLSITLMPIIELQERSVELWRGRLAPKRPGRWWSSYRAELKRLAHLAEREALERLVIGAELGSLEGERGRWIDLIQRLRARFSGLLTYSANWDHYRAVSFWEQLDEVSVTAYFPLERRESLEERWSVQLEEMERFAGAQGRRGRPLMITEYGYPALSSALSQPWNETTRAAYAPALQAELVTRATALLLREMHARDTRSPGALRGATLWNWFGFGGERDRGYTLRGRSGQARLSALLAR